MVTGFETSLNISRTFNTKISKLKKRGYKKWNFKKVKGQKFRYFLHLWYFKKLSEIQLHCPFCKKMAVIHYFAIHYIIVYFITKFNIMNKDYWETRLYHLLKQSCAFFTFAVGLEGDIIFSYKTFSFVLLQHHVYNNHGMGHWCFYGIQSQANDFL